MIGLALFHSTNLYVKKINTGFVLNTNNKENRKKINIL